MMMGVIDTPSFLFSVLILAMATHTLSATALAQARAAWLAGDPSAWQSYLACLADHKRLQHAAPVSERPVAHPRKVNA